MALEGIFVNCVTEILKKLVPVVAQEINLAWGVKDEMKKLQDTLEMILAVIVDAERRQVTDKAVSLWLRRLKEVAYDADDVMDEFPYETMRRCERGNSLKLKARDFLSSANPLVFHFKMARKMKSINQRLDRITKDMSNFQLQATPFRNAGATPGESSEQRSRDTASSINESDIFGREDDKRIIIDMLMKVIPSSSSSTSSDTSIPEKITVVSIVGMGGLGKTTLAQLVYKDELVGKQFELTMWVYVSEHFDVIKLLTKIMESSTKNKFDTLSNYDVLVSKVEEQLNGKRYLLVLDDLWNENADQWDRLCIPLLAGAQGSKILITTRKTQVADIVRGSIPPYKLGKLQEDECWSIMEKRAFSPGGAVKTPNMTSIGKGIAKKCSGVPLAAKFLGGLMRLKNKEADWLSIQEVDVLNTREGQSEIIPIIKLSYDNLSSELKQCFSYCSIFPKDWEINRVTLIQLWIAEGFLNTRNVGNGRSIEDIADEYFVSLVSSSFLDAAEKSLLGDIKTCKMHDLVHDLAKAVSGDQELASVKVSELNHNTKIRRLRLILDVDLSSTVFQKSLSNAQKLRTLFIPEGSNLDPCIFAENKHLRILHVGPSPNACFPKSPSLSFKLRHLRYLHLTCIDLRGVENDQSINKLYSLESLVLNGIGGRVQILISNIHSLKKLRYLEVSFTYMVELPDSVTSLCNLQTLDLNNCELKVIPESICGLRNLRFLNLSVNPFEELPVSVTTLSNLETLDVNTCKNLKALPEYVAGLPNLRVFDFKECPLLKALPIDIGALTLLRYLNLAGTQISVLPESCVNLNNLEIVDLDGCEVPKDVKNWKKLRRFYYRRENPILGLGQLIFLEELIYPVQEKLKTEPEGNNGIEELGNLNSLEALGVMNLQNVKDPVDAERANLKAKQNLRTLHLHWEEIEEESGMKWDQNSCNFQVFQALQPPTCLRRLGIDNFMVSELPTWMCGSCLPNLVELEFINCVGIKQLPAFIGQLPHLKSLKLQGRHFESLDISGFPSLNRLNLIGAFLLEEFGYSYPLPCLQELVIESCNRLREIPSFPSLERLKLQKIDHKLVWSLGRSQTTSLTELSLENIEELIYFPISILRKNSNLRILHIQGCNQLEGFGVIDDDKENNVALTGPEIYTGSPRTLKLFDCAILKFLPDLRAWTCLQFLYIFNCPQVKESLNYDLKSLSFLKLLKVDFIQRDQQRGDPSDIDDLINLME